MNKDKPSLELRQELLEGPVIIVDDVTYRSPEDMPRGEEAAACEGWE